MARSRRIAIVLTTLAAVVASGVGATAGRAAEPGAQPAPEPVRHGVVTSFDGTPIAYTEFRPTGPVPAPVVLDSHGWGGSRRKTVDATVQKLLDAGFGVVSFDQRGFGESGSQAHIQDADFEARDVMALVDEVAGFDWVALEGDAEDLDPVLGAVGGSYGGGYQLMTALTEQATRDGGTRFDVLAPEITWHDLNDSLAPSDVPRTAWITALYAAGARSLPDYVHRGFVLGTATGTMPAETKAHLVDNGPSFWTNKGVRLDIPVLFRQGASDNLFNLNQGLRNFDAVLTAGARARSALISYNGGHALPNALPPGGGGTVGNEADACSGSAFLDRAIELFTAVLGGGAPPVVPAYRLTTADGTRCVELDALPAPTDVPVGQVVTPAAAGPPLYVPLPVEAPFTVAGTPWLRGTLTAFGPDPRAFVGLAVGTSPADARVVHNNLLPLTAAQQGRTELPAVAVDVAEGETLYLVVSAVSDVFAAHGSRTPGALVLDDAVVELPVVGR